MKKPIGKTENLLPKYGRLSTKSPFLCEILSKCVPVENSQPAAAVR